MQFFFSEAALIFAFLMFILKTFQVNPEDLFRQAFGGNFDFESIFGADPSGKGQPSQNQTRTRVKLAFNVDISYLSDRYLSVYHLKYFKLNTIEWQFCNLPALLSVNMSKRCLDREPRQVLKPSRKVF